MLSIGILTPRSTLYPALTFDILNGLKASLAHSNISNDITLVTENIGFGTDEAEIYTKAEKMVLDDRIDTVIACCDSRIASMLQPMFTAAGKLLLVINFGANLPEGWQPAPTTVIHSLNFCFHSSLTGKLAAANKTAALLASYYDAGYNQVYTIVTNFQKQGGEILFNHVTHIDTEKFTLEPLKQQLATENAVESLLCLFSADMAALFYRHIQHIQENYSPSIFVSPMMLDESLAVELKNEVVMKNVQGFSPWLSTLDNENNREFIKTYSSTFGKQPTVFALLGWDTGLLIDSFVKQLPVNNNNTIAAIKAMYGKPLPSPRGWLKLDEATHHTYGPAWLVSVVDNFEFKLIENTIINWDDEWQQFTANNILSSTETHSGWRNTYLCI